MASFSTTETFRFLDFPREIRDRIYRTLLCSFEPRPATTMAPLDAHFDPDSINHLAVAQHSIDTTILLASKQIHREAYDIMVKTNRYVRVTTSAGLPLRLLLNHLRVPIVTDIKDYIDDFPGCVLSVSLTCPKDIGNEFLGTPLSTGPCSLMLLGRDMDVFCDILMDGDVHIPGFGMRVAIKIAVAPDSILALSPYKDSMLEFFSEKTQQLLLQPFRTRLRGFKKAKVRGTVSRAVAEAVEKEIAQDAASDPEAVISMFQTAKDEGQNLYRSKQTDAACLKWQDAALEIEQLHGGSSWHTLCEKGGVPFVARLVEIYFLMRLNVAHIKISGLQKGELFADVMAEDALIMAIRALKKGYWMPEFQWQPSDMHRAKLRYRQALFLRLEGDPSTIRTAVSAIGAAHRLLPDDAGIARERDTILAWRALVG